MLNHCRQKQSQVIVSHYLKTQLSIIFFAFKLTSTERNPSEQSSRLRFLLISSQGCGDTTRGFHAGTRNPFRNWLCFHHSNVGLVLVGDLVFVLEHLFFCLANQTQKRKVAARDLSSLRLEERRRQNYSQRFILAASDVLVTYWPAVCKQLAQAASHLHWRSEDPPSSLLLLRTPTIVLFFCLPCIKIKKSPKKYSLYFTV